MYSILIQVSHGYYVSRTGIKTLEEAKAFVEQDKPKVENVGITRMWIVKDVES